MMRQLSQQGSMRTEMHGVASQLADHKSNMNKVQREVETIRELMGNRCEVKLQQVTFKVIQQVNEMQNNKCSEQVRAKHEQQTGEQAKDKDETEDGTDGETHRELKLLQRMKIRE